ncbi:hypothetical protein [Neisseria dentiae]|uniref:hypothetical protein n=3 Tax=Neisseria dentiae TaxID=194197 RepID=UPI0035A0F4F5
MDEKKEFQFKLMKQGMISGGLSSLERLMLERDFDEAQENLLYDILDRFSQMPDFSYGELEREMDAAFGWSYQGVKGLIISLHDDGRWSEVVYQYLKSNYQAFNGRVSIEYERIVKELKIFEKV